MGRHCKDYSGEQHGCWIVKERDFNPSSKSHETFWICECQNCGTIASVRKTDLDRNPQFCNNCKGINLRSWKIGDRYGLLTIVGNGHPQGNHTYVTVQCDCGSEPFEVRLEHLKGCNHARTISCGCTKMSSGEIKIKQILDDNNVIYEQEYRIPEFNIYAPFDFAIFDDNKNLIKLIEYDGEQHFQAVDHWGGEDKFKIQQERDSKKDQYCKDHNIYLHRIPFTEYNNINLDLLLSVV